MEDKEDGVLVSFSIGVLILILYFSRTHQLYYTVALDNGSEARRYVCTVRCQGRDLAPILTLVKMELPCVCSEPLIRWTRPVYLIKIE